MDIRSLRFFLAAARTGSMKGAAESLHLTQPNITRTVRSLEEELGAVLFLRTNKGLMLTPEGERLQVRAEELIALMDRIRREVGAAHEDDVMGDVHVAAGETGGMRLLAQAMQAVRNRHPAVRFHVVSGNDDLVMRRVDAGLADFGIVFDPTDVTRYAHRPLPLDVTWGVVIREDSPLASVQAITPEVLSSVPLIVSQQLLSRNGLAGWFGPWFERIEVAATYTLINTPLLLAEAGLGALLTFDDVVRSAAALTGDSPLRFRPLDPPLTSGTHLIWRQDLPQRPALRAFYDTLTAFASQWPNPSAQAGELDAS